MVLGFDCGGGVGILEREQRLLGGDFDRLRSNRYGEIEIERGGAANLNRDGLRDLFRKSWGAHGNGIGAGIDLGKEKTAIGVSLHAADRFGVDFSGCDGGAGQCGAGDVEHRAGDGAGGAALGGQARVVSKGEQRDAEENVGCIPVLHVRPRGCGERVTSMP